MNVSLVTWYESVLITSTDMLLEVSGLRNVCFCYK